MRNFDTNNYIALKVQKIIEFFENSKLDSVVLGISGGVDSAVALMLYMAAAEAPGSPLKKVRAVVMPIYGLGTSGQAEATDKAQTLVKMFASNDKFDVRHCDLTDAYQAMVEQAYPDSVDPWTSGQMASVLRTPMLYYQAAILQKHGFCSVVSGTTNRDEGSYIGFFGKASDGMVDVQPIGDIHKSEVYRVAKALNVPAVIIDDEPKGDVWDMRTDVEMIGAPYWFLQEFLEAKCLGPVRFMEWSNIGFEDSKLDKKTHQTYISNIEKLHKTNKHKYQVGSPAHFIDVLERAVPGGWVTT